jgi:hypothetical protein
MLFGKGIVLGILFQIYRKITAHSISLHPTQEKKLGKLPNNKEISSLLSH